MEEREARLAMMHLANLISVPMSLNAAVKLGLPDLIWQGGANQPVSAHQLATLLKNKLGLSAEPDAVNLQRVLRILASHGVFRELLLPDGGGASSGRRSFQLTNVGRTLVSDPKWGLSLGGYVLQHHQDALVQGWTHLHECVLDSSQEAFRKVHGGLSAYEYYGKDPAYNDLMQEAMCGVSVPIMEAVLQMYDGFGGEEVIRRVVDVGGSSGVCLAMILEKHPGLEGVNFDLPEVVDKAPQHKGVTHVGGNMFDFVPPGDAIFMKWVLTTWSDNDCKQILENCHKALPEKGKVIVCEPVVPENTDDSNRTKALLEGDIFVMAVYSAKGKHRTEEEYRNLAMTAGFTGFRAIYVDLFFTLMEFLKRMLLLIDLPSCYQEIAGINK